MSRGMLASIAALLLLGQLAHTQDTGSFNILTFNVAGLPAILNTNDVPGDKTENAELIGTKMKEGGYNIINVQEDFNYHAALYSTATLPYRTPTSGGAGIGSGLNSMSLFSFDEDYVDRIKWETCSDSSGADCLTPKGITYIQVRAAESVYFDVYNLHADAGDNDDDLTARQSNIQQLSDLITANSPDTAVLVCGDTNTRYTRSGDNIRILGTANNLTDPWVELVRSGTPPTAGSDALLCDNPSPNNTCEIVDKCFYRGSSIVSLAATSFSYVGSDFLSANGTILSDHNPVLVDLTYTVSSTIHQSDYFGGGTGGSPFSDLGSLPASPVVSTLTFRGAERLDSVGLILSDGTNFTHGGTGGTEASLSLATDEFWTSATLCKDEYNGSDRNFYISATTSSGQNLTAGTETDDCQTFEADDGWQIVGFLGRSAGEVDQLAFIYTPQ